MSENRYLESLPMKRAGSGALIFDGQGRLLVVKPTYREGWLIPGGVVEAHESPLNACEREVLEETGLRLGPKRLLCVDYWHGDGKGTESLQFIFYGGILTDSQVAAIRLCEAELSECRFVEPDGAVELLVERLRTRVRRCLEELANGRTLYLEDGRVVF